MKMSRMQSQQYIAGDKTEQDLGRELLEPLQKKARTLPTLSPRWVSQRKAQQTVQAAQQTYWAQLHEAQQKVQEADTERIANEDRRSTTRVGDMTDEDLGHELVLFSAFVSKFVGRREN